MAARRQSQLVSSSPLLRVGLCSLVLLNLSRSAHAEPPAGPVKDQPPAAGDAPRASAPDKQANQVEPPRLLGSVNAEYPPEARAAGLEATVALRLTIDKEGRVVEAEVVEPAGHGFDEAARAAVLNARFEPARRNGKPVPSRIRYHQQFHIDPPPPPAALPDVPVPAKPPAAPPPAPLPSAGVTPSGGSAPSKAPIEVTVQGLSAADLLRESAQSVKVVDTEVAQRRTADLGEVLARTEGIGVRRNGGLGSDARFSLNGLSGDQVRFFLDGVPLDMAGYLSGVADVPVNLVERVEVYRGVVPVRFGADALGGAVNLVTDQNVRGTHASGSYEVGSFGTYRVTVAGQHLHRPTGFFARASAFSDHAKNNYPIDVMVPDDRGRLSPARAYRFHDSYRASGAVAEVGFVNRPWARRLLLHAFVSGYDKDLQHNTVMTVPYGDVHYGGTTTGATLRYEQPLGRGVSLDALAGYTYSTTRFVDVGTKVYDWFGHDIRPRAQPGEIRGEPTDQSMWQQRVFGRVNVGYRPAPEHGLHVSLFPIFATRAGEQALKQPGSRDPLTAERRLFSMVSGAEYEIDLLDDRLENIFFAKDYLQVARTEELLPRQIFARKDRTSHELGVGDGLRYRFTPWLLAKASYEYATRLPSPDEVFGNGVLVLSNLDLEPERSHNVNLDLSARAPETPVGELRLEVNGFLREADQLIVLLGDDRAFQYQNVFGARSLGVEAAAGWTSPGNILALDGNVTVQDFRNTSKEGAFGAYGDPRPFEGARIPNRPWLFANGSARLRFEGVLDPRDEIAFAWNTRYVHEFFRGWENVGRLDSKQVVPSQLLHAAALTYVARRGKVTTSATIEINNLADARAYDLFGVQLPGRAFLFKGTLEM